MASSLPSITRLFSPPEVAYYRQYFMDLRAAGTYPGDYAGVDVTSDDPLQKYPRMIHMHRWDDVSLHWLLDERLRRCLTAMLGREPYAAQSMLYFKPPGARGQALHQDQYYLRVQPGTCIAAWLALDRCDEENGCLQLVPGSHKLPVLCVVEADKSQSFTDITVPVPDEMKPKPMVMEPGDLLFFHGQLIHGSYPNTSQDRFRRALIGHYIEGQAEKVTVVDHPVLRFDGTEVKIAESETGGDCGVWVDEVDKRRIEMKVMPRNEEMEAWLKARSQQSQAEAAEIRATRARLR